MYYLLSDSSPAYNGTEYLTHLKREEDPGSPNIPNETTKTEDLNLINDISEADDRLLWDAANLLDSANSVVTTDGSEIEQARFFTAFSRALKSRKVLLHRRLGVLLERQYRQDISFWHRAIPRMLNSNPIKKRKYRR
jgi:hypothetical protein